MEPEQKSQSRPPVSIVVLVGLVLVGIGALVWMTRSKPTVSPPVVKELRLVYATFNPTEVVGLEGTNEHYRTRLDLAPIQYGVGGDHLVLVGHNSVAVVNIRTGELLARKPLETEYHAYKQGVVESVYVDSKNAKCYFCGSESQAVSKPFSLVVLDLVDFSIQYVPLHGIFASKVIPIGNDLGFCASDTVYRFSRPPLSQRNGYQGEHLPGLSFRYLPGSGLYSVDSNLGTLTHLTDPALKPLPQKVTLPLADKRLDDGKIAFVDSQDLAVSASWPTDNQSVLRAVDLVSGHEMWETRLNGQIDQLLVSQSKQLWMLDRSTQQVRTLDLESTRVMDAGKLPDGPDRHGFLVWAR